jgi:hypothetical protein
MFATQGRQGYGRGRLNQTVISERVGISTDAAFEMLRGFSRNHNRRLHDVARDLVDSSSPPAT